MRYYCEECGDITENEDALCDDCADWVQAAWAVATPVEEASD